MMCRFVLQTRLHIQRSDGCDLLKSIRCNYYLLLWTNIGAIHRSLWKRNHGTSPSHLLNIPHLPKHLFCMACGRTELQLIAWIQGTEMRWSSCKGHKWTSLACLTKLKQSLTHRSASTCFLLWTQNVATNQRMNHWYNLECHKASDKPIVTLYFKTSLGGIQDLNKKIHDPWASIFLEGEEDDLDGNIDNNIFSFLELHAIPQHNEKGLGMPHEGYDPHTDGGVAKDEQLPPWAFHGQFRCQHSGNLT